MLITQIFCAVQKYYRLNKSFYLFHDLNRRLYSSAGFLFIENCVPMEQKRCAGVLRASGMRLAPTEAAAQTALRRRGRWHFAPRRKRRILWGRILYSYEQVLDFKEEKNDYRIKKERCAV